MSREYTLENAAKHILAAVKEIRFYCDQNRLDDDDSEAQYLQGRVKALQKLADKLNPPQEAKDGNVVQFVPRSRIRNE